jgi:hypothetical protein
MSKWKLNIEFSLITLFLIIFWICIALIFVGCNKENFKDERYSYCYKTYEGDEYWGCNNFVVAERLNYDDSIKIHSYYDNKIKERLKDTTFFISRITHIYDEPRFRAPRLKIKD